MIDYIDFDFEMTEITNELIWSDELAMVSYEMVLNECDIESVDKYILDYIKISNSYIYGYYFTAWDVIL